MALVDMEDVTAFWASPCEGDRLPVGAPAWRAVTVGPHDEDWAVVDDRGVITYVGPAILAARFAANALR